MLSNRLTHLLAKSSSVNSVKSLMSTSFASSFSTTSCASTAVNKVLSVKKLTTDFRAATEIGESICLYSVYISMCLSVKSYYTT